jgi:uncharacterized protein (TIGR00369 family)
MKAGSASAKWFPLVLAVPLIQFLDVHAVDEEDPAAGLSIVVSERALNAAGVMHGGAFATLLDLAAYLAVLPLLDQDEQAVTHALSASYLAPVPLNERVLVRGEVLRRSRRLAFAAATMTTHAGELVAAASVTKSIVSSTRP